MNDALSRSEWGFKIAGLTLAAGIHTFNGELYADVGVIVPIVSLLVVATFFFVNHIWNSYFQIIVRAKAEKRRSEILENVESSELTPEHKAEISRVLYEMEAEEVGSGYNIEEET